MNQPIIYPMPRTDYETAVERFPTAMQLQPAADRESAVDAICRYASDAGCVLASYYEGNELKMLLGSRSASAIEAAIQKGECNGK